MSDQKIIVSGQLNFYKSFLGIVNATDGTFIDTIVLESSDTKYKVGYSSYALEMNQDGDIFAGISFLSSSVSIVRITPGFTS